MKDLLEYLFTAAFAVLILVVVYNQLASQLIDLVQINLPGSR